MHEAASILTDQYSALLGRLPVGLDLDTLAFTTGAITRRRKLGDGASLLRLALARGPGGLSLRETAAWASMIGLVELSNPGVKYRLDQAVGFLEGLIGSLLEARTAGRVPLWPGRVIRLADGSCVSKPGSSGTDWRVHGVFDLGLGGFSHLEVTDKHGAETLDRGRVLAGEIRIADRGYANAAALRRLRSETCDAADFIVRMRWNGLRLSTPDGRSFNLIKYLTALPDDGVPHQIDVEADAGRYQARLKLRLVIWRKSPEATASAIKALQRNASKKQTRPDPRSLIAAGFVMLATSLPEPGYPAEQILAAYRLRWQIELAFKRLKSLLHIDRLPARTGPGSRSWLYAHLILALICDDVSQEVLESSP